MDWKEALENVEIKEKCTLILVTSDRNKDQKDTKSYMKSIINMINDQYSEDINYEKVNINSHSELMEMMTTKSGSVLIFDGAGLNVPKKHKNRNADRDQIVEVVTREIAYLPPSKVLIVGDGQLGRKFKKAFSEENYSHILPMIIPHRKLELVSDEFLENFEVIINCTRYENPLELFYRGTVYDVARNFKPKYRESYFLEDSMTITETPHPYIISGSYIGQHCTCLLLEDVINNGF